MATIDGGALGLLNAFPTDDNVENKPNLADESDAYFAGIKTILPPNKFTSDSVYTVPDNGLGLNTLQGNKFDNNGGDYNTYLMKNGSDIISVGGTQIGNVEDANVDESSAVDNFFKHQTP